jgi:hypothetical protein
MVMMDIIARLEEIKEESSKLKELIKDFKETLPLGLMSRLNFVRHTSESGGKVETDDYLILAEYPEIDYTLLVREAKYEPFVAAWAYNKEGNYWGQGHYFADIVDACAYIKEKLDAKEGNITTERITEIATGALHKIIELDGSEMAYDFFHEYEMDMSEKELEFFGCIRNRVAYEICWDVDDDNVDLPSEVKIPENIDDDDIADYLSDEFGFCVRDYSVEEDE